MILEEKDLKKATKFLPKMKGPLYENKDTHGH